MLICLQDDLKEVDAYLEKMGVTDAGMRRRLETHMPGASEQAVSSALPEDGTKEAVVALNREAQRAGADAQALQQPALVVCCDASGAYGGLERLLEVLEMPCWGVAVPQVCAAKGGTWRAACRELCNTEPLL